MQSTNVLILGGGPAGYVAALRTAQAGIATVLVDRGRPGGTCLHVGCIPSKAVIHAADAFHRMSGAEAGLPPGIVVQPPELDLPRVRAWKEGVVDQLASGVQALLTRAGVRVIQGEARVLDGKTVEVVENGEAGTARATRIVCQHLVIATGSQPAALSVLPFGGRVISSTDALALEDIPASLIVVGGGYIGLELGIAYAKLGTQVTLVEAADRILPEWDAELTRPVQRRLKSLGMEVLTGMKVEGGDQESGSIELKSVEGGLSRELRADTILVAVGRKPLSLEAGVGSLMLDMDGPFIRIDEQCRTSMRQVWAIGDVTGAPMLAHRAMAQAEVVANVIGGRRSRFEPAAIPAICYCDPEIVSVGMLPEQAKALLGGEVLVASFPFAGNGRALTMAAPEGFVRVVARRDNHRILGWQAVGAHVSELAAAFGLSVEMCARLEDITGTVHAHPTLSEAAQEAALKALGQGLHG